MIGQLFSFGARLILALLALLLGWLTPAHAVPPPVPAPIEIIAPAPDHDQAQPDVIIYLAAYRANGPPTAEGRAPVFFVVCATSGRSAWWNWYAYCGGDPVNRADPSGLDWVWVEAQDGFRDWVEIPGSPRLDKPTHIPGSNDSKYSIAGDNLLTPHEHWRRTKTAREYGDAFMLQRNAPIVAAQMLVEAEKNERARDIFLIKAHALGWERQENGTYLSVRTPLTYIRGDADASAIISAYDAAGGGEKGRAAAAITMGRLDMQEQGLALAAAYVGGPGDVAAAFSLAKGVKSLGSIVVDSRAYVRPIGPSPEHALSESYKTAPKPRPKSATGLPQQEHHAIQQEWAKQNLPGYDPKLAPTVRLETGSGTPHSIISARQGARARAARNAGLNPYGHGINDELNNTVDDLRAAGFSDHDIAPIMEQQYKMLNKLHIPYVKPPGF